jgi:hypothetical protein
MFMSVADLNGAAGEPGLSGDGLAENRVGSLTTPPDRRVRASTLDGSGCRVPAAIDRYQPAVDVCARATVMSLEADMFDQLAVVCQLEARGNGLAAPLQKPQAPAEFATDQWSFPHLANGLVPVLSGPAAGGADSSTDSHCMPAFSVCAADFT